MKKVFLESFDEYGDALFRFCMVKTGNRELSEDLVQETFMRFWQALREGKEMTNTRSFLYTIANHMVIDWYRKKKSDSLDARMEAGFNPSDSNSENAQSTAEYLEALAKLDELDEGDRVVMLLRFVEGFEPRDIADMLGVSANVVSVRIDRATKRLQKKLNI